MNSAGEVSPAKPVTEGVSEEFGPADTSPLRLDAGASAHLPRVAGEGDGDLNLTFILDELAVGGCFPDSAAEHLAQALGITAVVDLRAEACDDETLLRSHGMTLLHLPTEDHCAVSQPMLDDGVAFALSRLRAGEKVLIHCQEGVGRSALVALCVLVALGLDPMEALHLAKDHRWQVSPSPPQYHAWVEWLTRRGVEAPDFESFAKVAYRHLFPPEP